MKKGMILEGGAMRGLYTAGVMDVLMENNIEVDGYIGVSAGAVFGCNFKSRQIGRVLRYNLKYCRDSRYGSLRSLIKTGDYFGAEFCYHILPNRLDIFDKKAFQENPTEFYVVCTDVNTGEALYHKCETGGREDCEWMRESASMPFASTPVKLDGRDLLDGGIADSIPIKKFQEMGFEKNLVVLTQVKGYRKKKESLLPAFRVFMKKYPEIIKMMEKRHVEYNETIDYIETEVKKGKAFVLRPSEHIKLKRTEKDTKKLKAMYELGRKDALKHLEKIRMFLE